MRPVEITIEGLRSFRAPVTVTFDERELVAIIGDTGAGKSSILEALTWALYGNATWTKQAGVLIGDGCPQMRVRLDFHADGATWRVTRAIRRRQDGSLAPARAELYCLDDDGDGTAADGVRQVDRAVQELLGLDWEAFTRTVVLPQGQFARLLTEGDVDRMRILSQIWRTDELVAARASADDALRDLAAQRGLLQGRRQGYPEDVQAELVAARERADRAKAEAERLDTVVGTVTDCQRAAREAAEQARGIGTAVERLQSALQGDPAAEAQALADAAAELDGQLSSLEERIRVQDEQVRRLQEDVAAQADERAGLEAALRTLVRLADVLPELADQRQRAADLRSQAERGRAAAEAMATEAAAAQQQLNAAEDDVARWQRTDAAASAAHGLHAGDDCPVCVRPLPQDWQAPDASGLATALERRAAVRQEAEAAHRRHADTAARAASTAEQANAEAGELAGRLKKIADAVAALPAAYRPALPTPFTAEVLDLERLAEAVAAARAAADTRREELSAADQQLRDARDDLQALREERTALQDRRHTAVTAPAAALLQRLRQVCERVDGCAEAGVQLPAPVPALSEAHEALQDLADQAAAVAALAHDVLQRARQAAVGATERAAEQEQQLAGLLGDAGVATAADLQERQVQARAEAAAARQRVEELERAAPVVAALEERLERCNELAGALTDLKTLLQDGRFIRWLTLRRSRALLAVASTVLGEMTGGRYAFADITDEHDEWRIFDTSTGYARSPRTLSGGESFVASLALALGMVEMVARSGGRLDALFLDEGFGALDRDNLDAAIDALESSATKGRMVAVISHVQAVAERVTDVLAVEATPGGSQARWLSPSEREGVVTDEAASSLRNLLA